MIYHICSKQDWEKALATDAYQSESLQREGFIHFSKADQVVETADLFYQGRTDLVLLEVDENKTPEICFEPAQETRKGSFPHLYGSLPAEAVLNVIPFPPNTDGRFSLPQPLLTLDIISEDRLALIHTIIRAALDAVDPEQVVNQAIRMEQNRLIVQEKPFDLPEKGLIYVVSLGKAALKMTKALDRILSEKIKAGIVITKMTDETVQLDLQKYQIFTGGHPIPNDNSLLAAKKVLELAEQAQAADLVIFLVSGGGSALMTLPEDPITLQDFQELTRLLLASGADIHEMNVLRKHLDAIKGGKLALAAAPAKTITCILSDVVGNSLESIASGPTVPDPSTFADCRAVLDKYELWERIPDSIRSRLESGIRGELPETLKASDPLVAKLSHFLIGDNAKAGLAAAKAAKEAGWTVTMIEEPIVGEARIAGEMLAQLLMQPVTLTPQLTIGGGETIVKIKGEGLGGRNIETALAAVETLAGRENVALVTLATDGEDGPTDAAGAIVTGRTFQAGIARTGHAPESYLETNDSYHYFEKTGGLIQIGSTGTNVNDLVFLFHFSKQPS